MEINYTLYFFAFFEKVIKKTIDILLLEKRPVFGRIASTAKWFEERILLKTAD